MMCRLFCLASLLVLAVATTVLAQQPAPKIIVVKAGRVLDVRTGQMTDNAFILIEGDRIRAVGPNITVPAGAEVIDLKGMTLLPGLIDSHTHLTFEPSQMGYSSLGI